MSKVVLDHDGLRVRPEGAPGAAIRYLKSYSYMLYVICYSFVILKRLSRREIKDVFILLSIAWTSLAILNAKTKETRYALCVIFKKQQIL